MMKPVYKYLLVTIVSALGLGVLAIAPVVNSDNGYVAGFVFLPLLFLIGIIAFILFFVGLVTITKKAGPYLLLSALLLPTGFFGAALIAKQLELGAYREEPMIPFTPQVANIVLFKKSATHAQIEHFLENTLSTQRPDGRGHEHLPGVQGTGRLSPRDGHEVVDFSFFANATDDQKRYVYDRIRSSPIVYELRENVPTKDYMPPEVPDASTSDTRPKKTVVFNGAGSTK